MSTPTRPRPPRPLVRVTLTSCPAPRARRSIPLVARFARLALLALTLPVAACPDDAKRPLGSTCGDSAECASGLCVESKCLDPAGDDDGDGLVNGLEAALGTSPLSTDTDQDGASDRDEVGPSTPRDLDGDGRIDALESAITDQDGDCLVDQRDADDATPESDPTRLAAAGCCCDGLCPEVTPPAAPRTATCIDGRLVCTPPEDDRDGDGLADRCDAPALSLSQDEVQGACADACQRLTSDCEVPPLTLAACLADCTRRGVLEGLWVANYGCLAETCDPAPCLEPSTRAFPEPALCPAACAQALACGLYPTDGASLATCRAACAGSYVAPLSQGGTPTMLECLATLDADPCTAVDLLPCTLGDGLCEEACAHVGAAQGSDRPVCPSGAPIYARYPTAADCVARCDGGGFSEVAMLACGIVRGCSDPGTTCESLSAPGPESCPAICASLSETCPTPLGDPSACQAFCAGLAAAIPWFDPTSTLTCLGALEACPSGGNGPIAALLSCMAGADPRCADACQRFATCAGVAPPNCELGCTSLALSHPERIAPTFTCLAGLTSCEGIERCTSPSLDAVCAPACAHVLGCSPDYPGGLTACRSACATALAGEPAAIADWYCEATASTCVQCQGLSSTAVPAACASACQGSDTCVEAAYGACPRACQGALENHPDAACVVSGLGRRCDASALACP